ncbi:protein YIF1B-like isoform X2 [Phalaenopsis equestris]|uniref:protein YIF1B-like isoform X2 n=1 Tax=Phalaenopsis equestris TaxID=78828 RepID=UPI0009E47E06|nr:protein YIF1B-like isoform X2 [Phalaenopsis equestris]
MEHNLANWPGMQRPPSDPQSNPFGNVLHGAGSGIIRGSLGAYGEKFFGSSSEFMQSNVNGLYVWNKLKVILFPFLHRGHWTRITEPVAGRLSYKPPIQDINAPDLYIPFMAFGTYIVLTGFYSGVFGRFSPEALSLQFTKGLFGWLLEVLILKGILYSMGSGEAPLFDIVAYGGYAFAALSLAIMTRMFWSFSYYFMLPWICICTGVFLLKTMKRVLLGGTRGYEKHSSRQHYLLLLMVVSQFPLLFWLGSV